MIDATAEYEAHAYHKEEDRTMEGRSATEAVVVQQAACLPVGMAAPVPAQQALAPMRIEDVLERVRLVQDVIRQIMVRDTHYGVIPGTGDKPSLYQAGAELLSMTFRLRPRYTIEITDLGEGHRSYRLVCDLYNANGGHEGQGVGECSTMENKYRYRWDSTGRDVPQKYWSTRDPALLGGPEFKARKAGKQWRVFLRVEHDNPADYWNTCLKIGKKRAFVDGTKTAVSASSIFTQDIEDRAEDGAAPTTQTENRASEAAVKLIRDLLRSSAFHPAHKTEIENKIQAGMTSEAAAKCIDWMRERIAAADAADVIRSVEAHDIASENPPPPEGLSAAVQAGLPTGGQGIPDEGPEMPDDPEPQGQHEEAVGIPENPLPPTMGRDDATKPEDLPLAQAPRQEMVKPATLARLRVIVKAQKLNADAIRAFLDAYDVKKFEGAAVKALERLTESQAAEMMDVLVGDAMPTGRQAMPAGRHGK